jgi:hypothetical protein
MVDEPCTGIEERCEVENFYGATLERALRPVSFDDDDYGGDVSGNTVSVA